jgi:hypothetical protein
LTSLVIRNPFAPDNLIHLLFDGPHLYKNFYNNFRSAGEFCVPTFPCKDDDDNVLHARFSHLKELYELELGLPEKKAYKLNDKMMNPTSTEKQSVQLATACFHDSTIKGLQYYAKKGHPEFADTSAFLQIIRNWFDVINVKSKYQGQKSKNIMREKIDKTSDQNALNFLLEFYVWLQKWETSKGKGLSAQTFHTARVTSRTFVSLVKYLLDEKDLDYVLLGLIQSDYLEGRFGWFRQLCGGNYFNSVLQFLQAEKSIRIRSLVKAGYMVSEIKEIFKNSNEGEKVELEICINGILDEIRDFSFENNFSLSNADEATLYYTAGSIARSLLKRIKCSGCKELVSAGKEQLSVDMDASEFDTLPEERQYIALANRGGLLRPSNLLYITCQHAWSLYSFIIGRKSTYHILFACSYPRNAFVGVFLELLKRDDNTNILLTQQCQMGCKFEDHLKLIAIATFNIKAKNFISEANDRIHSSISSNKIEVNHKKSNVSRKLKKLKSN